MEEKLESMLKLKRDHFKLKFANIPQLYGSSSKFLYSYYGN